MANVFTKGETFRANEMPVVLVRKGKKETVYQNFVYEPYRDSDGTILGVLAISQDVTEQVLARKKIELAEEKTRLAITSADLGVYEINLENNEVSSDDRFKNILDLPEIVTLDKFFSSFHEDDRGGLEDAYKASLESKQLNYLGRVISSGNSLKWIQITGTVISDNNYRPLKLIGVGQDVTAAVIAQKKIEESEKAIRNMILQAPVAMGILRGPSLVVEIANQKMFELWGREENELINKPIFEGLPEAREQGLEPILQHVFTTGESFVANERPVNLPRNGKIETTYLNFVYEPHKAIDDTVDAIILVATDVTAQVVARHKIEEVVTNRTMDLANANDNLQKSNAELAQFAYIASHDLQEPLRKISTYSQMLEKSLGLTVDENSRKYLNKINNSSLRMNNLIRDVLNYSELAKDNELFSLVDLNEIVENIKTDYELLIEQKGAVIEFKGLPKIEAIPLQMSQLFGNMISNALKFSRNDISPLLTITASKLNREEVKRLTLDPKLTYYKIRFADNGIGLHPEHVDQIFNIFQRLHRKSEYEGTGIGLALCKKIALNHHGLIDAIGSSERGAVFNVILPKSF
jgi:signal transduction histidine kinase